MKTIVNYSLLILFIILLSGCCITSRRYMPGFYVDKRGKNIQTLSCKQSVFKNISNTDIIVTKALKGFNNISNNSIEKATTKALFNNLSKAAKKSSTPLSIPIKSSTLTSNPYSEIIETNNNERAYKSSDTTAGVLLVVVGIIILLICGLIYLFSSALSTPFIPIVLLLIGLFLLIFGVVELIINSNARRENKTNP